MAYTLGVQQESAVAQMITNWMGDDGFLKVLDSQFRRPFYLGDTIWTKGKVVKKYIDNGEHLVDIEAGAESNRGWTTLLSKATVQLIS